MGKGVSRHEFNRVRHRRTSIKPGDDSSQRQLAHFAGSGGVSAGGTGFGSVNVSPSALGYLAGILIPAIKQLATTLLPQFAPIIESVYALYLLYQKKEMLAKVARKISDEDLDGFAGIIAVEIAKKGVEKIADYGAQEITDKSTERLKAAGLFESVPEAEGYYRAYMYRGVRQLMEDKGERFVEHL